MLHIEDVLYRRLRSIHPLYDREAWRAPATTSLLPLSVELGGAGGVWERSRLASCSRSSHR